MSREEIISLFDISDVNKSSAVFDIEKTKLWMNGRKVYKEADLDRTPARYPFPICRGARFIGEEKLSSEEHEWLKKGYWGSQDGV